MINIKVNEEDFIEMLVNRVKYWTNNEDVIKLYESMYEIYAFGGCFEGCEASIDEIVDNDYVNYCTVIEEGDEDFDDILKVYESQGLGDCSCEDCNANFIEAVNDEKTMFLIRWW